MNEAINNIVDLEWIIDKKRAKKKHVRIYKEDDATMASFKIIDYVKGRAIDNSLNISMNVDQPTSTSA